MINWKKLWTKKVLISLLLGQFVSLLITSTSFSSSELSRQGINAPTSQSLLNYVLLAIVYGFVFLRRGKAFQKKWYYYLMLSAVDVEANFLVVKAYQYTSLTSVMLLDCWTIPCVLFLTWIFLKTKYSLKQLIGVAICVGGLITVVFSDVYADDREAGSHPVKGDLFAVAGATLYAVSNVGEEFLVKNGDRVELVTFLGVFGAVISGVQIAILERKELKSIHWSAGAVLPFLGFSIAMFLFYSAVPVLLQMTGSAMLNLSLQTSDLWGVFIRNFAYHEKVDWLYFVAFAAVIVGLIIYSRDSKEPEATAQIAQETHEVDKKDDEETGIESSAIEPIGGNSLNGDSRHHSIPINLNKGSDTQSTSGSNQRKSS